MRAVVLAIALSAVAASANAETLQVAGQAGHLGEWELTANVTAEMQGEMATMHFSNGTLVVVQNTSVIRTQ